MVTNQGQTHSHVSATTHRPLPKADGHGYRNAHHTPRKKSTGLDWDALRPKCTSCGQPSSDIDHTDHCPACRGETPTAKRSAKATKDAAYGVLPDDELHRTTSTRRDDPFPLAVARRLYLEQQLTIPAVAKQLGLSVATVRRNLKAAGTPMRDDRTHHSGGRNRFTPTADQVDHITRLYLDQHLSTTAIGNQLGIDRRVITRVLIHNGVTIRPPAHLTGADITDTIRDDVIRSYRAGASLADLATKHRIRKTRLRDILTAAGIPIRPKGGASGRNSDRIRALGVTAHDIKTWAIQAGHADHITPGLVPAALIDAYAAAHPSTTNHQGDTAA